MIQLVVGVCLFCCQPFDGAKCLITTALNCVDLKPVEKGRLLKSLVLRPGMKQVDVRRLLGTPTVFTGNLNSWSEYYSDYELYIGYEAQGTATSISTGESDAMMFFLTFPGRQ